DNVVVLVRHVDVGAFGVGRAGVVARAVERQDLDRAADGVLGAAQVALRLSQRFVESHALLAVQHHAAGGAGADRQLTATGAGSTAVAVVAVVAGADQRRVADAAGIAEGPTGG